MKVEIKIARFPKGRPSGGPDASSASTGRGASRLPTARRTPCPGRPRRDHSCALAVALTLSLTVAVAPSSAHADTVYWQTRDLLASFFPSSQRVTFRKFDLDGAERSRVEQRLGYRLARDSYTFFVATTGDRVDGYALLDDENGQHLPISFAVKLSPAGTVERQEVTAYRESHGEGVRDARFRSQFVGKTVADTLRAGTDISVISGATISSRSMTIGVKRALVLFDELVGRATRVGSSAPAVSIGTSTLTASR